MKKIILTLSLLTLPLFASADFLTDGRGGVFGDSLINVLAFINNYIIPFILGVGFFFFVWGMFVYFIYGGANDESKEKGKSLMVWAILGFVLILIFWGVVNLIADSTGFSPSDAGSTPVGTVPNAVPFNGGTPAPVTTDPTTST